MPEIDRYRPEDQRGVEALYRRVFGARRRRRQPASMGLAVSPQSQQSERHPAALGRARRPDDHRPLRHDARAAVARRAGSSTRHGAPTRWWRPSASAAASAKNCSARGTAASAPRWASASPSLRRSLLKKLHWPDVAPIPGLVKPLTRRAVRLPTRADAHQPVLFVRHVSRSCAWRRACVRYAPTWSRSGGSTPASRSYGNGSRIASRWPSAATRRI